MTKATRPGDYNQDGFVVVDPADFIDSYQPPPIAGDFCGKHIVTVDQFAQADLEDLFATASTLKKRVASGDRGVVEIATGQVLALLFFESSTRTDMSFQAAMLRLGGKVIGASNGIQFSSVYKGEDLPDTVRAAGCYADVVVLRHPAAGASYLAAHYLDRLAAKIGRQPIVINAGDGAGEHPTQALLDLFTIIDQRGTVNNLHLALVGDLKHGRTVHSLAKLLVAYGGQGISLSLVSPAGLAMPPAIVKRLQAGGLAVRTTASLAAVLPVADVIYWTRIQEERFATPAAYNRVKDDFILAPAMMEQAKSDAILLHPLPRKHEMGSHQDHDRLDQDQRAFYFQQMENGMLVRMALLAKLLNQIHI